MLKLIDIDSSFFNEEPVVRILDLDSASGRLTKTAADSRVSSFVSDLKPEAGKIYVHILAMGAGEYFGANKNADYFPEENLIRWHDTFRTSPAHIFKHHINKNPEIAIGKVIYSVYNERMHRVEIIAWIDSKKGWDIVDKIERGEFPATSMACHTPYDTCSICKNQARSRNEYCTHLRSELGRVHADGTKTMAINDGPLKFFDMSVVFKPADVTSSILQKVAYAKGAQEPVLGSAESAQVHGLTEKSAEIKKLSALIKEVEGTMTSSSGSMKSLLDKVKDPEEDIVGMLEGFDLDHVIHALADLGISPSIGFFAKLIGRKICGESVSGIERLVQGLIQEDSGKIPISDLGLSKSASDLEVGVVKRILDPLVKSSSLFPEMVMERSTMRGPFPQLALTHGYTPPEFSDTYNVGYVGNGPHVAPDPRLAYRQLRDVYREKTDDGHGLLKTLFTIGGAAIAAKWLISRLIESRMQELREEMRRENSGPTKIVLVKSAEQAFTTQQLVKASLIHSLKTGY